MKALASYASVYSSKLKRVQVRARIVTGVFTASILLYVLLLLWPYFYNMPHGDALYETTHSLGLSPQEWWPFADEGVGLFLYQLSLPFFWFARYGVAILAVFQSVNLWRSWFVLGNVEKVVHTTLLVICAMLAVFLFTPFGQSIYKYLGD